MPTQLRPRVRGIAVRDRNTGVVWFSPNHYTDFYRL
jgi:hypothetical protein